MSDQDLIEALRVAGDLAVEMGKKLLGERDDARTQLAELRDALEEVVRVRDDPTGRWVKAILGGASSCATCGGRRRVLLAKIRPEWAPLMRPGSAEAMPLPPFPGSGESMYDFVDAECPDCAIPPSLP